MLIELINILAPTFICPLIGVIWARAGYPYDVRFVSRLGMNVAVPCLVFTTLLKVDLDWDLFTSLAGASVSVLVASGILTFAVLRLFGQDMRAFLPPVMFNNCGNLGLPLCLFAFGEAGLALAIVFFTLSSLSNFTFGVWVVSGKASPLGLLKTPLIYAVLLALAFLAMGWQGPVWLTNTTSLLGGMLVPMMLMTLGVSVANLRLSSLPLPTALAVLRLALGVGLGYGMAWLFDLEGLARGVLIIQSAMPVAVTNYLFAEGFSRRPADVASLVLISTVMVFMMLPLLLADLI